MPPSGETADRQLLARLVAVYLFGAGAGAFAAWIGSPLPWMIGPLLATASLYLTGVVDITIPVKTRPIGQIVIASQVGVYFSPAAFAMLLAFAPLLIGMALATACCALVVALLLARVANLNLTAAFLSSLPTSPVEAAVMAERYKCNPGPVILSQTVRIASVVVLVPVAIYIIDGWPTRDMVRTTPELEAIGVVLLAGIGMAGALLARACRVPNPFFLGPLAASSAISALGVAPSFYPSVVLSCAQIILGVWLGSTFRRSLFAAAGRLVTASIVTTLLMLALTSMIAVIVSRMAGLSWELMVLGTAPGGVTEMALTAKFLGQDVALITAFHLTRIFILMPNIPWIIRMIHGLERRRNCRDGRNGSDRP
ncbi:AbrB family transcriptional regulator [Sinorhizobium saheli]|uniref:AbrB family transcriptional regulator n=1 Tax=Sinorhizobium saheli TaxID=36856 RepID=UPI000A03D7CA|nr:AbrB family transcriptional regulator [Sinorhizobium saheli]MQW86483.1 AbrB family transcriptional regulator [Sinorhizobium saheli]